MATSRSDQIPHEMNLFRGMLGDVGIPHTVHKTKTGKPYIMFDREGENDRVSLQYRRDRTDRATGKFRAAHFLLFSWTPGKTQQDHTSFSEVSELLTFLGIDENTLDEGRSSRPQQGVRDRATSIEDKGNELDLFRGCLGDAGVAHRFHRQPGRRSYISFEHPVSGAGVLMQYRRSGRDPETGIFLKPHFAAIVKAPGSDAQTKLVIGTLEEAIAFLDISVDHLRKGKERRAGLDQHQRTYSIVPAAIERSYIAMMR